MPASQNLGAATSYSWFPKPPSQCMCDCLWEDPHGNNKNSFDADLE